jgi:hypothetical protein
VEKKSGGRPIGMAKIAGPWGEGFVLEQDGDDILEGDIRHFIVIRRIRGKSLLSPLF